MPAKKHPYTCKHCGDKFNKVYLLWRHRVAKEDNPAEARCLTAAEMLDRSWQIVRGRWSRLDRRITPKAARFSAYMDRNRHWPNSSSRLYCKTT
jgi:hypothetical protein